MQTFEISQRCIKTVSGRQVADVCLSELVYVATRADVPWPQKASASARQRHKRHAGNAITMPVNVLGLITTLRRQTNRTTHRQIGLDVQTNTHNFTGTYALANSGRRYMRRRRKRRRGTRDLCFANFVRPNYSSKAFACRQFYFCGRWDGHTTASPACHTGLAVTPL